jgi:hypothetical protein
MTIVQFPSKLPTPQQLELPRANLCSLAQELAADLTRSQMDLMQAKNPGEFAAAIRKTADKLAESAAAWTKLKAIIRESWGI